VARSVTVSLLLLFGLNRPLSLSVAHLVWSGLVWSGLVRFLTVRKRTAMRGNSLGVCYGTAGRHNGKCTNKGEVAQTQHNTIEVTKQH